MYSSQIHVGTHTYTQRAHNTHTHTHIHMHTCRKRNEGCSLVVGYLPGVPLKDLGLILTSYEKMQVYETNMLTILV